MFKHRIAVCLSLDTRFFVLVDYNVIHIQSIFGNGTRHQFTVAVVYVATGCLYWNILLYEHLAHFCPVLTLADHGVQGCAQDIHTHQSHQDDYNAETPYSIVFVSFHVVYYLFVVIIWYGALLLT